MGTASLIALQRPNGTCAAVRIHSDGGHGHTGKVLIEHYNSAGRVAQIIALGDGSVLMPDVGEKHNADWRSEDQFRFDVIRDELLEENDIDSNPYTIAHARMRADPRSQMSSFYIRDWGRPKKDCAATPVPDIAELVKYHESSDTHFLYLWTGKRWWTFYYIDDDLSGWRSLDSVLRWERRPFTPGPKSLDVTCKGPRVPVVEVAEVADEPVIQPGRRPIAL